jgi:CheY-like chemotaxis protein
MTYQVLVAGDDVETKVVIKKALAELEGGIEVIVVENTGQAIERFSSTAFDLVIVDVCEPVTDSIEAVKVIHMSEPDLPILVYTGVGGDDIKTGALKA